MMNKTIYIYICPIFLYKCKESVFRLISSFSFVDTLLYTYGELIEFLKFTNTLFLLSYQFDVTLHAIG